ncbi:MAG: hypothetical protein K6U11_03385 [bacterium]|nr:hypothetical protein [bacterium]
MAVIAVVQNALSSQRIKEGGFHIMASSLINMAGIISAEQVIFLVMMISLSFILVKRRKFPVLIK